MSDNNKSTTDNCDNSNEKLKIWLPFVRFILGSVIVTTIGLLINSSLKLREIENHEMQLVGTYIEYALTKEIGERKRFSEYFAAVIRSKDQRKRWITYDSLVTVEYNKVIRIQDSLIAIENAELKKKEEKIIEEKGNEDLSPQQVKEKIKQIEDNYEEKISDIQNQLSETKVKLQVKPITKPVTQAANQVLNFDELKNDELAQLIVDFLVKYSPDCFNSARIREWGKKRKGFNEFHNFTITEIQNKLNELYFQGVINKGKCRTKSLFSISNTNDLVLKKFKE